MQHLLNSMTFGEQSVPTPFYLNIDYQQSQVQITNFNLYKYVFHSCFNYIVTLHLNTLYAVVQPSDVIFYKYEYYDKCFTVNY